MATKRLQGWIPKLWLAQFLWALLGGLPFLVTPGQILNNTTVEALGRPSQLEVDQVRLIGATSLGISFASALGITAQIGRFRRGLAVIFMIFMGQWATTLTLNQRTGNYHDWVPYLTVYWAVAFAILNLVVLWKAVPPAEALEQDSAAARENKPFFVQALWLVQGIVFVNLALACLFVPRVVLATLTGLTPGDPSFTQVAVQQVVIVAAWTLAVGLLSLFAVSNNGIRSVRQFRWPMTITLTSWSAVILYNHFGTGTYSLASALFLAVPGLLMAFGNWWMLRPQPDAAGVQEIVGEPTAS